MQKMKFSSLVETFAVDFQLILPCDENGGEYVHGEWIPKNKEPKTVSGVIIPYDNRTIYQSGGTLTSSDRQLAYVGSIPLGAKVIDNGREYKVESEEPYAEHYADVNLYRLKAVTNNATN
ncbi:hypothetical protein POB01_002763 [Enterococcus faecalis]|uniref:hypothetical protein n=1 Tax=Enterococcus faecalis TaxID=1351 RepID=UPI000CF0359E|nr:hypothetical protein [Enterococcus faecalis]EGO7824153.1 hypothetical protein [Enterococcus faecalis]EGO9358874.1 hypothetical protein [Enterococcus faecalis]EKK5902346.1 hypothetical protein [Enterococcus faecalis]EKL7558783.1 hypothetical protein [Enterococcus faecalis]PQB75267.1 hypothetical protein CUN23_03720 [Enterococcus faecalis]